MRDTSVNFRVLGIPQAVARFQMDSALAAQAHAAAIEAAAEEVETLAKGFAPFDTYALRDSIQASKIESSSAVFGKWRVTYGKAQFYGRFQELGVPGRFPAHPFLRPASDSATLTPANEAAKRIIGRM